MMKVTFVVLGLFLLAPACDGGGEGEGDRASEGEQDHPGEGEGEVNPPGEGEGDVGTDDTGHTCSENSDCNNNTCLKGVDADGNFTAFGYCTKPCENFSECPTFWDCTEVGNAAGTFCVQDG